MHADEDHTAAGDLVHGEPGIAPQRGELRRRRQEHHVGVAGLERDHPGALLGHDLEDHAVEQRLGRPSSRGTAR